ncbi:aminopeptidase N [Saxibacter everestensis]|uniref:Aminopeptidase N n=1 Tax=Saxibacter everestensis TaxID=2909229 RepID=A0ABY8QYL8_9MICO|nr:aminopeptidase N [Brevibacteriaceae bacterium ZFBP1038]
MNLTRDEAAERADLLDVSFYDVVLDIDPEADTFRSVTTVRFTAAQGASTFIDAVTARVHQIELNGQELDAAEVVSASRISLPVLSDDNVLVVDADFSFMNTGEGLHKFVDPADGEVYLYSQFEVADSRRVFAVFEQPDLKATFSFAVTAPASWQVISNSPTPSPEAAGTGIDITPLTFDNKLSADDAKADRLTWRFAPTPPMSSYITAIIAGPYESVHSQLTSSDGRVIPLGVFARKSLASYLDADNIFRITRQGFEFYEKNFGLPYPFEKYDQLFVPEFNAGAMENAGAVTFLEQYVFRSKVPDATVERRTVTILHELAHMWFGDLVTMKWWNDLWLNESFAEYMSTLATAEATEWKQAWTTFASLEKAWAYRQDQLPSTHPIVADIRDLEDVEVNFDGITYAKGASVLKQLVAWVGQDEFLAGVRQYFQKHAWSNTQLSDLLSELEQTSGRDLSAWSKVWLEEAGLTSLRPEIVDGADGLIESLEIVQEAPELHSGERPSMRPHRLAVGFYDLDPETQTLQRTERLELDVAGERTSVTAAAGLRRPALILLNDDDLAYAKIRLDPASFATASAHLGQFADSLPRTLIWSAAWDMTRDAETDAHSYVSLVLDNISAESDSTVVLVLLRQLATAVELYANPEQAQRLGVEVGEELAELAHRAGPGSDQQLQFVKAAARHARTESQLTFIGSLFHGGATMDGLEVDTDLRWDLLTSLVTGGKAGNKEIEAELGRDNTASGHQAAALARAAVPTAEAKEKAWADVVDRDDLPNAVAGSIISGFNRVHDSELLEPFAACYFDVVRRLWQERTHEMAQQLALGLYPAHSVRQETVDATDAWLADNSDAPAGLLRLVSESKDGLVRALRAQARDAAR